MTRVFFPQLICMSLWIVSISGAQVINDELVLPVGRPPVGVKAQVPFGVRHSQILSAIARLFDESFNETSLKLNLSNNTFFENLRDLFNETKDLTNATWQSLIASVDEQIKMFGATPEQKKKLNEVKRLLVFLKELHKFGPRAFETGKPFAKRFLDRLDGKKDYEWRWADTQLARQLELIASMPLYLNSFEKYHSMNRQIARAIQALQDTESRSLIDPFVIAAQTIDLNDAQVSNLFPKTWQVLQKIRVNNSGEWLPVGISEEQAFNRRSQDQRSMLWDDLVDAINEEVGKDVDQPKRTHFIRYIMNKYGRGSFFNAIKNNLVSNS